jgi:hypothetical protein
VLAASLDRLYAESASWRQALESIAGSGRRAIVVTPEKVRVPDGRGGYRTWDPAVMAEVHPIVDEQSRVDTVIVVVNLDLLRRVSGLPVKAADFEDDLDRIVAHEVYGHAIPYLLAGDLSGKCADPAAGQSPWTACAIQRENVIRKEMRLGQRFDYGWESLWIARRHYH